MLQLQLSSQLNTYNAMTITYYGHSCFLVEDFGVKLLFDPFISGNDLAKEIDVDAIDANYIFISHGHSDHILNAEGIALRTGAKVVCSYEIHEWLNEKGVSNTHPMNVGGSWAFEGVKVKCVVAQHSSGLPDGSYGGNPMGFLIETATKKFYYSGDTALTMDMQLIPRWMSLDFAFLPIGDNFTMNAEDAIVASDFIQCTRIIPMHYDTFGYIQIDHNKVQQLFEQAGKQLTLMAIGSSHSL